MEDDGRLAPGHTVSIEDPTEGPAPAPPLVVVCYRAPIRGAQVVVDETVIVVKGKGAVVETDAMLVRENDVVGRVPAVYQSLVPPRRRIKGQLETRGEVVARGVGLFQ